MFVLILFISLTEITIGSNMMTMQNARVPAVNGKPVTGPYLMRVFHPKDEITAFSDSFTFYGSYFNVKCNVCVVLYCVFSIQDGQYK